MISSHTSSALHAEPTPVHSPFTHSSVPVQNSASLQSALFSHERKPTPSEYSIVQLGNDYVKAKSIMMPELTGTAARN